MIFRHRGAPEKSRTPNLQIRSLALYPIELRAPIIKSNVPKPMLKCKPFHCWTRVCNLRATTESMARSGFPSALMSISILYIP